MLLPNTVRDKERELVALPELENTVIALPQKLMEPTEEIPRNLL
jgi:hypothetical protein